MPKRRTVLAAMGSMFSLTAVSWASMTSTSQLGDLTESDDYFPGGGQATITSSTKDLVDTDKGGRNAGQQLYEIEMANAENSDNLAIHLALANPGDIVKVAPGNNPNARIKVSVWYESGDRYELDTGSVNVTEDSLSSKTLHSSEWDMILRPTVSGKEKLHVIAEVITPGSNNAPPGQQPDLSAELRFDAEVRVLRQ